MSEQPKMHMIATEEAFATPEYLEALVKVGAASANASIGLAAGFLGHPDVARRLCDIDVRLADMDAHNVDMQLLSITSPGVQVFDADLGTSLAAQINDRLAELVRQYPKRFTALAAVAPQDPIRAAAEVKRAMTELGLQGVLINSHTNGEFLDEQKFEPILEACERYQAPLYIHPTIPPDDMIKPYERYGMTSALWGFAAETGLHAVRMVLGGVFDRFPELQVVLGHMGEALPYFLFRLDNLYAMSSQGDLPMGITKLKRKPSDYIKDNMHITTSGMFWDEVLKFGSDAVGAHRIMFAIDHPFESSKAACDWIRAAPISPEHMEMILSGNAQRLFKIKV